MPASAPARMEQFGLHCTEFHEIWYLSTLGKPVEKIQVSLESDKNNGYYIQGVPGGMCQTLGGCYGDNGRRSLKL